MSQPRIFHIIPKERLSGVVRGCDNSYEVGGQRSRYTDWVIVDATAVYTCRCGEKGPPLVVEELVAFALAQYPNRVHPSDVRSRLDRVCRTGWDLQCAGCGRAVRVCFSPFESPPWSSNYRVSVYLVLETTD
jgi:hypothetical protein